MRVRLLSYSSDDSLGVGSTQATNNPADAGKDQPFWDSLNANVKNLHAVISGHGELLFELLMV
jgi:hypothetical protein